MPRIKALTEIMETLKNLTGIREETKHFTDDCEELRLKLMEAMKDINTLDRKKGGYSEDFQLRNSYLQYRFTDKMFFNLVKDVSFNLEKIHHLVHPLPFYYSPEPCDETDVLPTDLPSYEEIEEGEAEITRSNNTLDIKVTSDRAVITFEDVWVGAEAKVIIRLPSDKAIISVYQRSGRASYIFGKIECEKGLIEFYSPRVIPESSTNIKRVKIFRNNSYQPENTRLYPIDLTGHQIFNEDYEEFDQSNKNRDQDDRDTDPDFWQTPEGQFEQEWIALDEKLGDNFDSIIECRELLAIALKYQTAGHPFAKVRASELKIELADRLYKKVQTLPYDAQYPAIEKIRKLCEGATDCKGIEASKADLQLSIADWLLQDGDKLYQTNQDMAFNRYLEAVRLLLVAEKAGEISVSPHIEETQEAMEAILIDKALAFSHIPLGSPSNWKKYLHSLNRLFSLRDEFLAAGLNLRSEQLQEQLEEFENFKAAMLLIDSGP